MPKGVDEAVWARAKAQAEKQGQGENWAYVMSIYSKMSGDSSSKKTAMLHKLAGNMIHSYPEIKNDALMAASTSKVREQSLKVIANGVQRDILVLRPDVSEKVRKEAVRRARDLMGRPYAKADMVNAGLFPGRAKGTVAEAKDVICSGLVAHAYPDIDFRPGRSQRVVRPGDIHQTAGLKEIISYSSDDKPGIVRDRKKTATVDTGKETNPDTPEAMDIKELESYLQPGDIILTKPSRDYKTSRSPVQQIAGGTGPFGAIKQMLNKGERWGHSSIWVGNEPKKNPPGRLSSVKAASMADIFSGTRGSRPGSEMITRSAIVRPNLEKGIETRKGLGVDETRSNSNKVKSRNKNLIDVFS